MYLYPPTLMTETPEISQSHSISGENSSDVANMIEEQVQAILRELEQLAPDIQLAVYARLLNGLSTKLTSGVVTKAIAAARTDQQTLGKPKAASRISGGRNSGGARQAKSDDMPRADSLLRQLNDPSDPIEAWQRFGGSAVQLFDVLRGEPKGALEALLRHPNMPPGPKIRANLGREKLAEAIALRLEQYYRGA